MIKDAQVGPVLSQRSFSLQQGGREEEREKAGVEGRKGVSVEREVEGDGMEGGREGGRE